MVKVHSVLDSYLSSLSLCIYKEPEDFIATVNEFQELFKFFLNKLDIVKKRFYRESAGDWLRAELFNPEERYVIKFVGIPVAEYRSDYWCVAGLQFADIFTNYLDEMDKNSIRYLRSRLKSMNGVGGCLSSLIFDKYIEKREFVPDLPLVRPNSGYKGG